ncbi:MAG: isopenicillin N synthase family oxygenase [Alphaproteobacteria bacterium]|nr:isopenicillin N synthase family oxygenase [Alphaproteobacteria bacterium]
MSKATLPILDLSKARSGDRAAKRRLVGAVREACMSHGFFYLRNHGVPESVIGQAVDQARRFFRQPLAEKRKVAVNHRHRGFNALGDALMYGATRPDHKEFYSIGLELPEDDPCVLAGEPLRGPNNWPASLPNFRTALSEYYAAIGDCGSELLRVVALALDLDEEFFTPRYRKRLQRTQIIYYPPQPADAEADQFGVAPHTDFGCITLLWQDDSGGLQVRDRGAKAWIEANPIPGTLVVNIGDLLGRWTNDRFASTPHRVINRSGHERFSIATFYDPDFRAVVDACDMGTGEADCRYQPVSAGEHILGRFNQSFGYRKVLADKAAAAR